MTLGEPTACRSPALAAGTSASHGYSLRLKRAAAPRGSQPLTCARPSKSGTIAAVSCRLASACSGLDARACEE